MTYLQTEYFLHVAQNKSITKTASELYVSPPAISKQIALLEQELGELEEPDLTGEPGQGADMPVAAPLAAGIIFVFDLDADHGAAVFQ